MLLHIRVGSTASTCSLRRDAKTQLVLAITVFLDTLGYGIVIPVLPGLLERITGRSAVDNALTYGALVTAYMGTVLLCSQLVGRLSDSFGRRLIISISAAGAALMFALQAFADSVWILLFARVIGGACAANRTAANAYVADAISPADRASAYGRLNAAGGVGLLVGPVLGGYFAAIDLRAAYLIAAGLALVNLGFVLTWLPESLVASCRRSFSWQAASPVSLITWFRKTLPGTRNLVVAACVVDLATAVAQPALILFMRAHLHWNEAAMGWWLAFMAACAAVTQLALLPSIRATMSERSLIGLGVAIGVLALGLAGFIETGPEMYALAALYGAASLMGPAFDAAFAREVSNTLIGELEGVRSALGAFAFVVGVPAGTWCFGYCAGTRLQNPFPAAVFLLSALLLLISLLIARRTHVLQVERA